MNSERMVKMVAYLIMILLPFLPRAIGGGGSPLSIGSANIEKLGCDICEAELGNAFVSCGSCNDYSLKFEVQDYNGCCMGATALLWILVILSFLLTCCLPIVLCCVCGCCCIKACCGSRAQPANGQVIVHNNNTVHPQHPQQQHPIETPQTNCQPEKSLKSYKRPPSAQKQNQTPQAPAVPPKEEDMLDDYDTDSVDSRADEGSRGPWEASPPDSPYSSPYKQQEAIMENRY